MNTDFRTVAKQVTADGWFLVRSEGSHHQYKKEGNSKPVIIPNHSGKALSIGVLKQIENITGLSLRR